MTIRIIILVAAVLPLLSTCTPTTPILTRPANSTTPAPTPTPTFKSEGFITAYAGADFDGGGEDAVVKGHAFTFYASDRFGIGCAWKFIERQGADLLRVRMSVRATVPMGVAMFYDYDPLIGARHRAGSGLRVYPGTLPEGAPEKGWFVVCVEELLEECCVRNGYVEVRRLALRNKMP